MSSQTITICTWSLQVSFSLYLSLLWYLGNSVFNDGIERQGLIARLSDLGGRLGQ